MKAFVIVPFDGVADGEVIPRRFDVGEEIGGALAAVALREKWAAEHPLDHDADGKPGGSLPKAGRGKKGKAAI